MKKAVAIFLCFLMLPVFFVYGKEAQTDIREEIIEEARAWIGTKYALTDGSDGPGEENYVDCSGFVMQVYKKFGYDVGRTVADQMDSGEYIECAYEDYDNLIPGDILIMNDNGHVGIYSGDGKVIHASYSQQQVVEVPIWNSGGINDGARRIIPSENSYEYKEETLVLTVGENKAYVFGEWKKTDAEPIIRDGKTMLPARFVAEALGAQVAYNSEERCVEISKGDKDIYLWLDSDEAEVLNWSYKGNESEIIKTGAISFAENGRTYTPVRFIAEELGAEVTWEPEHKKIVIEPTADI